MLWNFSEIIASQEENYPSKEESQEDYGKEWDSPLNSLSDPQDTLPPDKSLTLSKSSILIASELEDTPSTELWDPEVPILTEYTSTCLPWLEDHYTQDLDMSNWTPERTWDHLLEDLLLLKKTLANPETVK